MKEAILSVTKVDGTNQKMKVKLTDDHLVLTELTNHLSPLSSTAIDSPVSVVSMQSTGAFSNQVSFVQYSKPDILCNAYYYSIISDTMGFMLYLFGFLYMFSMCTKLIIHRIYHFLAL